MSNVGETKTVHIIITMHTPSLSINNVFVQSRREKEDLQYIDTPHVRATTIPSSLPLLGLVPSFDFERKQEPHKPPQPIRI